MMTWWASTEWSLLANSCPSWIPVLCTHKHTHPLTAEAALQSAGLLRGNDAALPVRAFYGISALTHSLTCAAATESHLRLSSFSESITTCGHTLGYSRTHSHHWPSSLCQDFERSCYRTRCGDTKANRLWARSYLGVPKIISITGCLLCAETFDLRGNDAGCVKLRDFAVAGKLNK